MRAAIDIGSNSVRLLIEDGTARSEITQLARGLNDTDRLNADAVSATLAALKGFADECSAHGCNEVFTFATEAVRRSSAGGEFCVAVKELTGLDVTVLSPEAEARLALIGAKKPQGKIAVCDLGGGSMELICSDDGKTPNYVKSLPLGVVVMKSMYNGDYAKAIAEVPTLLKEYGDVPHYPVIVCGGSACNIAAALLNLKVYDKSAVSVRFTAAQLDEHMPMLLSDKLAVFRPVCARRADTVPYGAIAIQALLNYLGATEFHVSDSSNLEAALKIGLDFSVN